MNRPEQPDPMREHWEAEAPRYSRERLKSLADELVLSALELHPGERLLEIGFGSGLVAGEIRRNQPHIRYYGLDFAQNFILVAQNALGDWGRLIRADALRMPFQSACFKCILEMDAIHHFPRAVLPGCLSEVARVLQPGGQFISVEDWARAPADAGEQLAHSLQRRRPLVRQNLEYHPREEEWRTLFSRTGFEIERLEHVSRTLNLDQFANLEGQEAGAELHQLRELWGTETPTTTMTMFICRKT